MRELEQDQAVGLKEWAVAVEALRSGRQFLIMRKGGIREETKDFQIESESFYLYPTYEHQRKELISPDYQDDVQEVEAGWSGRQTEVMINCYAELAEDILISSQEELDRIAEFHIWTNRFAEERLKWKRAKPLHLMVLRVYELDRPVSIPVMPEYNGCKSWIGLPSGLLNEAPRRPVLTDSEWNAQISELKAALR
ncbi:MULTISPECIES: DUF1802 family protein [unclassified Paenibacillus]|uniref:DUF1802 family protein n=1 Tax=unclassified Paenibacillus TaxID=185978 RepID=UPI001AE81168|nr:MULTISPECIES: DUF1802 family protein [unclassified Paenibacillus]MBP1154556.1 hypothetical protein [Paenibacillus sp. PvP091]MBP1170060.1 hypothetical protein [Paenibacillus sp. PvR098]MBP2441088.1 hypothetical protein [Paenibacillus sp. PvP052]